MVKIADDLARATELVQTFTRDNWNHSINSADRDALVWLLEVAGGQHAYIRSRAFRDVVTAAYQLGRQTGLAERAAEMADVGFMSGEAQTGKLPANKASHRQKAQSRRGV